VQVGTVENYRMDGDTIVADFTDLDPIVALEIAQGRVRGRSVEVLPVPDADPKEGRSYIASTALLGSERQWFAHFPELLVDADEPTIAEMKTAAAGRTPIQKRSAKPISLMPAKRSAMDDLTTPDAPPAPEAAAEDEPKVMTLEELTQAVGEIKAAIALLTKKDEPAADAPPAAPQQMSAAGSEYAKKYNALHAEFTAFKRDAAAREMAEVERTIRNAVQAKRDAGAEIDAETEADIVNLGKHAAPDKRTATVARLLKPYAATDATRNTIPSNVQGDLDALNAADPATPVVREMMAKYDAHPQRATVARVLQRSAKSIGADVARLGMKPDAISFRAVIQADIDTALKAAK